MRYATSPDSEGRWREGSETGNRSRQRFIDKLSSDEFQPDKHDEYRERFLALVEQKTKGKEITVHRQHRSGAASRLAGSSLLLRRCLLEALFQRGGNGRPQTT
jgi:hypothetical protein